MTRTRERADNEAFPPGECLAAGEYHDNTPRDFLRGQLSALLAVLLAAGTGAVAGWFTGTPLGAIAATATLVTLLRIFAAWETRQ